MFIYDRVVYNKKKHKQIGKCRQPISASKGICTIFINWSSFFLRRSLKLQSSILFKTVLNNACESDASLFIQKINKISYEIKRLYFISEKLKPFLLLSGIDFLGMLLYREWFRCAKAKKKRLLPDILPSFDLV